MISQIEKIVTLGFDSKRSNYRLSVAKTENIKRAKPPKALAFSG